jgi:hypothetical protein
VIKANHPLRLPARAFESADSQTIIRPVVGIPFTGTIFPTVEQSWAGRPVGGSDRYRWPIPFTAPMMARWRSTDVDSWFSSFAAFTPTKYAGKLEHPLFLPRSIVYSPNDNLTFAAIIRPAILTALTNLSTPLSAKGVVAAEGPILNVSGGHGILSCRFPIAGYTAGTAPPYEAHVVFPDYEPDHWLAGEVLYISVGVTEGNSVIWGQDAVDDPIISWPIIFAEESSLWQSVHPRHSRVRHHNILVQEPGTFEEPTDEERQEHAETLMATLSGDDVTFTVINALLTDASAAITSSVTSAVTDFFSLA